MQNPMLWQARSAVLVGIFFSKLFLTNMYLVSLQSSNSFMQEPSKQSRNGHTSPHVYVRKFHCPSSGSWAEK